MGSAEDDILDTNLLSFDGDFNKQVAELLAHIRLTRSEVENLQYLLNDVTRAMNYIWPGAQVHPFGSIITGLGIKTSDIDCYIEIPHYYAVDNPVIHAKQALNRDKSRFSQTFAITTAKVPILKFVHVQTGFNCDINFSSLGGVRNSKLIAFLLNLDTRALHLAIILKYWSKVYNFTGTNLMPNYALTMMVIFYLQVKSVLPSVAELQQCTVCLWVDDWNTAFYDDFAYMSDNVQSLYELLGGFFEYYNSFDFTQLVLSPYLGQPVDKQRLGDVNNLPIEYSLYKQKLNEKQCNVIKLDTALCIQDPFEHSRNCSVAVFPKLFMKIRAHIVLAYKIFRERTCDDLLKEFFAMNVPNELKIPKKAKPNYGNRNRGIHKNQTNLRKEHAKKYYGQWRKYQGFKGPF